MKRAKRRTHALDWVIVQWSRACEEQSTVSPETFDNLASLAPHESSGATFDREDYLISRADAALKLLGVDAQRWRKYALYAWLSSVVVAIALGAIVFPCARVRSILDVGVNLAGPFLFFLLGQLLFLSISFVLLAVAAVQALWRLILRKDRSLSRGESLAIGLSSLFGTIVLTVVRTLAPLCCRLFGRRSRERFAWRAKHASDPINHTHADAALDRNLSIKFWNVLFSRPRFLFFWGGLLSHVFWASCSLCVLAILLAQMQGNRYNYCWHTSLEDERVVKRCVDYLAVPIVALGGCAPTEEDVERLFDDWRLEDQTDVPSVQRRTQAQTRARWSYFLLSVVFVWCVVPRVLLAAIYFLLTRLAMRDFRPDLTESYYVALLQRADGYRTVTQTEVVPVAQDDVIEDAPVDAPSKPIWHKTPRDSAPGAAEPHAVLPEVAPPPTLPSDAQATLASPSVDSRTVAAPVAQTSDTGHFAPVSPGSDVHEDASEASRDESHTDVLTREEEGQTVLSEPEPPRISPQELHDQRADELLHALGDLSQVDPFDEKTLNDPPEPLTLAFGYDATLGEARWRDLLGSAREIALFDDVAVNSNVKNLFKERLQLDGARIALCALLTDVSLPPARHFVIFMRDQLIPNVPNARIVVILTGGEQLRHKYRGDAKPISERLEDWTNSLEFMANATGLTITPVFFYDASLDLPEPREKLRSLLQNDPSSVEKPRQIVSRDLNKWNRATHAILEHTRTIYNANPFAANDELQQRLIAKTCRDVFTIYREELQEVAVSGRKSLARELAGESMLGRLSQQSLLAYDSVTTQCANLSKGLAQNCKERGLTSAFLENQLRAACGMSAKMRVFCRNLSPKCAAVAAAVGVTTPFVVALAPVCTGAVGASALVGALGAILPSSMVGGAFGGALGAMAPQSLKACKDKILDALKFRRHCVDSPEDSTSSQDVAPPPDTVEFTPQSQRLEQCQTAAMLALAASTWLVALELQDRAEDEIAAIMPEALAPMEACAFDSIDDVQNALNAMTVAIAKIPRYI
ncbi:MAG: DUF2868 domain-containing protein [Planctomycetia bacterium]|nr:DUF2868 domain-containing protein [Planctomycetia bacterium]